ncbi:hypothetical protein [Propionimicrobium lymphophilum]|uniref:YkvI family membrane protein n=1 Tax=Propionimicrobium lymphophilum TaxID=33012 RepID=UPI000427A2E6|nr:hypothetical protein [Propionimicrobium lymphophilum]
MSVKRTVSIAFAFIGLMVGAGFATGQETIQYFISAGSIGIIGAVIAGSVIAVAGVVILQLGSYYLADEHNEVFTSIAHKTVAKCLDVAVIVTLFAFGFVMLAGAGSTLAQAFDWPVWIGSTVMLGLVLISGFLDVEKITNVIGTLTPLVFVIVIGAFVYSMTKLPLDFNVLNQAAFSASAPVSPWWLSAINYAGLSLILGVSMVLVIGGNYLDPRETGKGGMLGGIIYMCLLAMVAVAIFLNVDEVVGTDVPMLALFQNIRPWMGYVVVFIVYAMIYNTCIGMFYALGRRLAAGNQVKFKIFFTISAIAGWAVSFIGFQDLMGVIYPALGYLGMVLITILVVAYLRERPKISKESERRVRIRSLFYKHENPDTDDLSRKERKELNRLMDASVIENSELEQTVTREVVADLDGDDEIDYSANVEGKEAGFKEI